MKKETMDNLAFEGTGQEAQATTTGVPRSRALSVKVDTYDISNNLVDQDSSPKNISGYELPMEIGILSADGLASSPI